MAWKIMTRMVSQHKDVSFLSHGDIRTHHGMHVQHATHAFSKMQNVLASNIIPCEHCTKEDIQDTKMANNKNAFHSVVFQNYLGYHYTVIG